MSQLTATGQTALKTADSTGHDSCPEWCESGPHADGGPHFGGVFALDLTLAEPGQVPGADGVSQVSDYLDAALWQQPGQHEPVIGLTVGFGELELPDMTLAEAETLAFALISLIGRARMAA